MLGQCLLTGAGISGVSTGVYAVFTNDIDDNKYKNRQHEYLTIFCIVWIVSILILYIFSIKSDNLIVPNQHGGHSPIIGGSKPPF
tara:strand:+ start:572 stop:826 length:255 start_codon:yes stop_codon:yes gene_type:complete